MGVLSVDLEPPVGPGDGESDGKGRCRVRQGAATRLQGSRAGYDEFRRAAPGAQPALPNSAPQLKPVHRRLPSVRSLTQNSRQRRRTKPHTRDDGDLLVLV